MSKPQEDRPGYAEWQFLEAFTLLCESCGGLQNGIKEANRLIKEQSNDN